MTIFISCQAVSAGGEIRQGNLQAGLNLQRALVGGLGFTQQ